MLVLVGCKIEQVFVNSSMFNSTFLFSKHTFKRFFLWGSLVLYCSAPPKVERWTQKLVYTNHHHPKLLVPKGGLNKTQMYILINYFIWMSSLLRHILKFKLNHCMLWNLYFINMSLYIIIHVYNTRYFLLIRCFCRNGYWN